MNFSTKIPKPILIKVRAFFQDILIHSIHIAVVHLDVRIVMSGKCLYLSLERGNGENGAATLLSKELRRAKAKGDKHFYVIKHRPISTRRA